MCLFTMYLDRKFNKLYCTYVSRCYRTVLKLLCCMCSLILMTDLDTQRHEKTSQSSSWSLLLKGVCESGAWVSSDVAHDRPSYTSPLALETRSFVVLSDSSQGEQRLSKEVAHLWIRWSRRYRAVVQYWCNWQYTYRMKDCLDYCQ